METAGAACNGCHVDGSRVFGSVCAHCVAFPGSFGSLQEHDPRNH